MTECELGNTYMEKASKFEDASLESSIYMDICGTLDYYNGDVQKTVQDLTQKRVNLYSKRLERNDLSEGRRSFYQSRKDFFEIALKELQETYG